MEKVNSVAAKVGCLKATLPLTHIHAPNDLLGAEMKATFDAKKALAEAELRNEKLARLLGIEEMKNKQLQ
ncbi:hypothetical protein E2562_020987 [Oryza meyeriana var. granulata]|uniref:Uncharacterized protein n=1 Tax=Oryza meyeriana var. granulata TaxID=110450 RepID=A0A6G1DYF4_9ORYZ|nr:hypothetical protein E2562_020987 [Oryza meyeriana var. granulata]